MITRKEFNEMSFEEVWNYCCKQSDCFKDRDTDDTLVEYADEADI